MNVQLQGNEQITKLFNDWYRIILQHQTIEATKIKNDIEDKISNSDKDTNLLLYYSLLNFRYEVLTNGLNITKDAFNKIDSYQYQKIIVLLIIITSLKPFIIQFLQTIMKLKIISRKQKNF